MRKKAYRSVAIKNVNLDELLPRLPEGPVSVGVDVAKDELLVTVRDGSGAFQRPWKAKQPSELGLLVEHLKLLSQHRQVMISMESTGTYGDCLRQALTDAGLVPRRVSAKAVKDYSETFDGVPSNHDGKDAAMVAELTSYGKSQPWPLLSASEWEAKVDRHVHWLDTQQDILMLWLGRMEALLSRHWPELLRLLKLNSATVVRLIAQYGSPVAVAACPEAERRLRKWGNSGLSGHKVQAILESARQTVGVRMAQETILMLRGYADEALKARQEIRRSKEALRELGAENEKIVAMSQVVGPVTACVLWSTIGDPHDYHCGEAYRKAMGLNLKERSSGKHQGKLKISKRGSSIARRWLYFTALRLVQQQAVKSWYVKKKHKDQERGSGALVAVMRKVALALHAVTTRKEPFELSRLLPGKPRPRSSEKSSVPHSGGVPPAAQDLSPGAKTKGGGRSRSDLQRAPTLVSAPGTALESVPTVALSSAQVNNK